MTKKFYFLSLLVGLVFGMACFTSCCDTDDVTPVVPGGGGEEVTLYLDDEALPAGIIDPTTGTIQLTEGGELTLPFVVEPEVLKPQLTLSSADPSIVAVDGLKLIAKKPGKTTIYATAGNYTMQYDVNVKEKEIADTYLAWKADQLVETDMPATYKTVENADAGVNWEEGTYVVEGQVTINGTITLNGDVNLIIKDGAMLTAKGINGYNNNLSIYGQAQKSGQLVVHCSAGNAISDLSTLEVHSAKVTATSDDDNSGGFNNIKTFNVYGGSVDAKGTSEEGGYGIYLNGNGPMNIYGGEVKAEGTGYSPDGYGITSYSVVNVTVYGGKLYAECANNKALNRIILITGSGLTTSTRSTGTSWEPWGYPGTPDTKYVKVE